MKTCGRIIAVLFLLSMAAVLLSGCQYQPLLELGSLIAGESYPDAESYKTGAFSYHADEVTAVEVYWSTGAVELIESDSPELSVRESGVVLPEEAAMHSFLEDGILKIRFCESGVMVIVHPNNKRLTLELPENIDLSVYTTSAPVEAAALDQNSVLISARSGRTELGRVNAGSVSLSSSSGSICAGSIETQSLECNTFFGLVQIDDLQVETANLDTGSGGVELMLSSVSRLNIHTSSGQTVLGLPRYGAEVSYTTESSTPQKCS